MNTIFFYVFSIHIGYIELGRHVCEMLTLFFFFFGGGGGGGIFEFSVKQDNFKPSGEKSQSPGSPIIRERKRVTRQTKDIPNKKMKKRTI